VTAEIEHRGEKRRKETTTSLFQKIRHQEETTGKKKAGYLGDQEKRDHQRTFSEVSTSN